MISTPIQSKEHEAGLWEAVCSRDASRDGTFVFAVRSTGIYCRPSCPARRPRRNQVLFFAIPEAAEGAGFRSCRRCRPWEAAIEDRHLKMAQRICRLVEDGAADSLTLDQLAEKVGVSSYHLQRTFKRLVGVTPRQYADACRLSRFKSLVREGESLTAALYHAGYGSSRGLYERASSQLGMTPATYGRAGRGASVRYTVAPCPFGYMLVATTDRGVCAVQLGESERKLRSSFLQEYSEADVRRDDQDLDVFVRILLDHLKGEHPHLDLPLDIRATAFQWRVWQELRTVPYGDRRSYSEIAQQIGKPKAVRAVAGACASNPVALVVPCHRVVRKDGDPGEYRWGATLKRKVLERERSTSDASGL